MGLIEALGLKPAKARATASDSAVDDASPDAPGGATAGDTTPADPAAALDAKLGAQIDALTALLDQVHDDAAAAPARAELQKLIDGRARAAGAATKARIAALNTLLAAAAKQKPRVQALLKHAQAVERREAARKEVEVALGQVTALVLGGINHDGLRDAVNADLKKLQAGYDKADKVADLAGAEKAFLALKPRALELLARAEHAKAVTDRLEATAKGADAALETAAAQLAALGAEAPAGLAARLAALQQRRASGWNAGKGADEIDASAAAFAADVKALAAEIDAAKKAADAKKAFEAAYSAIRALVDAAAAIRAGPALVLPWKVDSDFVAARKKVDDAVAKNDWVAAQAGVPALQRAAEAVKKASADAKAFETAFAPLRADVAKVRAAMASPGLPPKRAAVFRPALEAVDNPVAVRDWPKAAAALPALVKALKEALAVLEDGKRFYAAFAPMRADYDQAWIAAWGADRNTQVRIAGLAGQFKQLRKNLEEKIAGEDWGPAQRMLPDVQAAAKALLTAQANVDTARKPYDTARAALRDRDKAEAAVQLATPPTAPLVRAYKQAGIAVNDAEHAADFGRAMTLLTPLQKAIDDLVAAQAAQAQAEQEFKAAFAALTDYAEARQLAAGPVPALAADADAFKAADQRVDAARQAAQWVAAKDALPALQAAATKLAAGKAAFNGAAKSTDFDDLEARLRALDPRVAKASAPAPGPWIEGLQKTVLGRRSDIDTAAGAKDLAAAEANLVRLLADLDALDKGLQRDATFRKGFDAVKNGEIAAARALALLPAALAADRTTGLAATEADITGAAGRGEFDAANALMARWRQEARGWKESQDAYAELHNGKEPKVGTLEALAKKPGGEQVLDAMILKLPPNTPAKVLSAALKARYGFEVKRFKTKNADETNLKGVEKHDPEQADPELVQVYKLLAQIPSKQIKGKVEELIDFDTDEDGGVYYPNKKIYVYSGRVGTLADGKKTLGDDVMPDGEEVDERCKPDTSTPEVPVSNFTLLHEAAHAEDRGTGYMEGKKGLSNSAFGAWVDESPASIAKKAAPHFGYDEDYIRLTLLDKDGKPPERTPKRPKDVKDDAEWERRRQQALAWCQAIRASAGPWWKGAVCKQIAIGGRVYQESYNDGRWSSYDYAARSQGISGYQFRAAPEWFAELYAAFFSGKLKPSHPAMGWLKAFKPPQA